VRPGLGGPRDFARSAALRQGGPVEGGPDQDLAPVVADVPRDLQVGQQFGLGTIELAQSR
jgi:hypothetical protein